MRFLRLFGILCTIVFASAATPLRRPNILLITLDTTRADRMGFLGSDRGLTPNLDALARQSIVFTHAYAHVPLTPPSHANILTGTYPQFNHLTYMGEPLAKELPYLPDIFRRRGYRTAAFVASMILDPKNVTGKGFERGFDIYDAGYHKTRKGEDRYKAVERRADEVVTHALNWLSKATAGPYFLWVHCYDPHGPYDPPEPYKGRYSSIPYDGEIAYMDSALGRLLNALRARGLYDNTMIVVTADHGEAFREHGERHHGIFLYDETIHVPLLIRLPQGRSAGIRVESRVRLVDIAPTILKSANIAVPAAMQGESLLELLETRQPRAGMTDDDRPAYGETLYAHRAFGWSVLRSWRAKKYLYIQAPERELYDQTNDAPAVHNLVPNAKAVADTLQIQLQEFRQKTSTAESGATMLSPEQAENLRALGYLPSSSDSGKKEEDGGIDPKSKIEIANLLTEALFDVQEDRFQDAVPKLQQVLRDEPNTSLAYLELGRVYVHFRQYDQALPLLKEAVARLPEDGLARYELGRVLVETKNWTDAAPQFEAAVKRTPKSAQLRFYLAVVYERSGRFPEAIREFQETIALEADHFRANLLVGRLLGMQHQAREALPYLKKAALLRPDSIDAHQYLANVYTELGQIAAAHREANQAAHLRSSGRARVNQYSEDVDGPGAQN